ncbi:hypothetical protein BGX24_001195 [Mortierella sp. AD032]|nr:hypothetical protein BGX24_001195 [Mortierella sp. AD032]
MTISSPPSTTASDSTQGRLRVLIVGGGIGGLMLGLMLERASIDYVILERSSEIRPLGSAISLNGSVLRVFEQLGMLEDVYKISKPSARLHLVKEDKVSQGHVDLEHFGERYGYYSVVFGRPDLLQLLISRIPPGKLILGKRILTTARTEFGVMVRCSDNSAYEGDILVGADGAYSSVRQNMYKELKDKKMLPRSDSKPLKFDQNIVVGITDELDPEKYPALTQEFVELHGIIGNKAPYTLWLIPIVGNRFAWSIGGRILDSDAGKEDVRSFSFAEWFPELATDVCDLVRDFVLPDLNTSYREDGHYKDRKTDADLHHHDSDAASLSASSCRSTLSTEESSVSNASTRGTRELKSEPLPHMASIHLPDSIPGLLPRRQTPTAKPGTVGEIIDATPNDRVSKVMLESKMFKTWYHERTVLIGDACHKILPFAGQGGIQAILDCISLANALYDMNTVSDDDITKAFKRYTSERLPITKNAVSGSHSFGKLLNIKGKMSDFVRSITFNKVPTWIMRMAGDKLHLNRPQLTYLPMVPDRGAAKAHVQDYSPKYLAKLVEERQAALAASANRQQHSQQNGDLCAVASGAEPETRTEDNNNYQHHHHDTRSHHLHRSQHEHDHNHNHADYRTDSSSYDDRNDHIDHNDSNGRTTRGEQIHSYKTHSRSHDQRHHEQHRVPADFYEFPSPPTAMPTPRQHDTSSSASSTSSSSTTTTTTTTRETRRKDSRAGLVPPPLPSQAPPRHHPVEYLHHRPEDNMGPAIAAPLRSPSMRSFNMGQQQQQQHHYQQQQYLQQQHQQQQQQQGVNQSSNRPSLVKRNTILSTSTKNTAMTTSSVHSTASSASSSPSSSPAIQPMAAYESSHSNPAREHLRWSEGYTNNGNVYYSNNGSNENYSHHNGAAGAHSNESFSQQQQQQQQRLPRLARSPLSSTSNFEVENSAYRPIQ